MENGPGLKMYFLSKMVIFQPAMLVYQRISFLFSRFQPKRVSGGKIQDFITQFYAAGILNAPLWYATWTSFRFEGLSSGRQKLLCQKLVTAEVSNETYPGWFF